MACFFTVIGIFALVSLNTAAYAAPAYNGPVYFTQPGGTVIQVSVKGDEFLGWMEDMDGNLIVFDLDYKGYCYAVWKNNRPVSTGELVGFSVSAMGMESSRVKGLDVPKMTRLRTDRQRETQREKLLSGRAQQQEVSLFSVSTPQIAAVSSLKRNVLMVHVTWSDRTGINTPMLNGNQIYDLVFNPAAKSVNDYYKELFGASEDIVLPAAVHSPLDGRPGIIEITLPGQHTNPGGDTYAARDLMTQALTEAVGNGYIDFSAFDLNNDGVLEKTELTVGLIIDGYEYSMGAPVPNFWGEAAYNVSLTDISIQIQGVFGQGAFHRATGDTTTDMLTIGIISHELGHAAYEFIDTYDIGYKTQGQGLWSLMSQGSNGAKAGEYPGASPGYVDAYNLTASELVTPGRISSSEDNITINTHMDIYKVSSSASEKQYFLLQQRKYGSTDNFDRGVFYSMDSSSNMNTGGLLIYHIDENVPAYGINTKSSHYGAAIVEAHGGLQHLRAANPHSSSYTGGDWNEGDLDDLWGGSYKLLSETSDPSTMFYGAYTSTTVPPARNIHSGVEIRNITWNSGAKTTVFSAIISSTAGNSAISATTLTSFDSLQTPYTQPAAQTVTITSTGAASVTLTQPTATYFDIGSLSAATLAPGATATFTVRPKAGLAVGDYKETITINGSGGAIARVNARFAVVTAPVYTSASTLSALQSAINDYRTATGDTVITVTAGFSITDALTVSNDVGAASLTIRSADPANPAIMARGFAGDEFSALFIVAGGAKLILEDIILDGNKNAYSDNKSPLVDISYGGELTMKDGAVLRNNDAIYRHSYGSGTTGVISGGVFVNHGEFTMTGGKITGNTGCFSGGVMMYGADTIFTMLNGEISGNTAEFSDSCWAYGGGVGVDGVFTMTGGEISGNTAYSGGGVHANGEFIMIGGEINGNTAEMSGGGVDVNSGMFTMPGGVISGNTAGFGGGVNLTNGGKFAMSNGAISGNTVNYSGGGIHVGDGLDMGSNEFAMTGGVINGNNAGDRGGGVYVRGRVEIYGNEFTMLGGEISGNTAYYGSGVYTEREINLGGTAVISGNTSNNVLLEYYYPSHQSYFKLSTTTPPAPGMDIGVQTVASDGVIVNSGASAAIAAYFHADESGKEVVFSPPGQLVITASAVTTYSVTVSSAGTGATGGGNYAPGDSVAISAGTPPAGQRFKNWTASPAVTFANVNSASTTFIMPSNPITVTAIFESIPQSQQPQSGSGGGDGGGCNTGTSPAFLIFSALALAGRRIFPTKCRGGL